MSKHFIGQNIIYEGNNLEVLKDIMSNSVDSIVTDPPYELGYMGKSWDSTGIAYNVELWKQCLRVLKPGGHLLSFGGTRTFHRMAVAIEDAGFEIRDNIAWLYATGFPKSLNVAKAIDKESEFVGKTIGTESIDIGMQGGSMHAGRETEIVERDIREFSDQAKQWKGWGTALKPAHEPIIVARKPFTGTVANNVLKYGTGAINIDATRIGSEGGTISQVKETGKKKTVVSNLSYGSVVVVTVEGLGRWPANIILDETTAQLLNEQSEVGTKLNYIGGASRFFYVAKISKKDRNEGLENLEAKEIGAKGNGLSQTCKTCNASIIGGCDCPDRTFVNPSKQNFHPTVKPTALMRYLIKLVTPPNGVVLDPFTGSGSTGKAAILEGKQFIGIELTPEYIPIILGRLKHAQDTYDTEHTPQV